MEKWDKELAFHLQHQDSGKALRLEKKPVHPKEIPGDLLAVPQIQQIPLTWFDRRGDIVFTPEDVQQVRIRGGVEYFKPSRGIGYGLNIGPKMDLFDKWGVAFHGVRSSSSIVPILKSSLRPGAGQAYKSQKDVAGLRTVPTGVYFSPNITTALGYTDPNNRLVLQCLVNPNAINITSLKDYWVVEKSQDIIPYRIIKYPPGQLK